MKKWLSWFSILCILIVMSGCSFSSNPSAGKNDQELAKQIKELAESGKTLTSEELSLKSTKDEILQQWGDPENQEASYLDYTQKGAQFTFDPNGVNKIFCYDPSLKSLTLSKLEKTFGSPAEELDTGGDYIIKYEGKNAQLYFGFDMSLQGQVEDPNVNYYYIEK
ncbi:DUF4309 domain-containing protein [Hazenella coriacea]|uniref:Uncharacterized protein DUF4309 n=1 Tax=Hazenella coriacea TaxID=1179467 RepID=A0A4R3L9J4_9BACL|nr:DUF4309 domain-containing protein [Hazenella coriacea]TCS96493.1 uncharacterized protein DUF4309 [Hazenella coriacea]